MRPYVIHPYITRTLNPVPDWIRSKCVLAIWGHFLPHFPAQSRSVEPLLWDSSIQGAPPFRGHEHGTQDLVPEKCSHNLCICRLY